MKKNICLLLVGLFAILFHAEAQNSSLGDMYDLAKVKKGLKSRRISSYDRSGNNRDRLENIETGEIRTIAKIEGAGIINHIWITLSPGPHRLSRNDIILKIYWDGNGYPSVESPIGPFFGQGWDERYNYSALPLTAGPADGASLVSYFSMPFAHGARIDIENQSDLDIEWLYFYIDYYEVEKLDKDMGRFHAWYNHTLSEALPQGETEWGEVGEPTENTTGDRNYVFIETEGNGHFVGINYYVHSPTPMWYGEGDDMWFIDGEEIPSMIGTGTEDFFNTSWCPKEPYSHPYFGYPRVNNDVGWLGRTHMYRFFIEDPIFFEKSIKGTIETGHENNLTLDLATVVYWYQHSAVKLPQAPTKEQRALKPFIGVRDIHRWRDEWRKNHGNSPTLWGTEK